MGLRFLSHRGWATSFVKAQLCEFTPRCLIAMVSGGCNHELEGRLLGLAGGGWPAASGTPGDPSWHPQQFQNPGPHGEFQKQHVSSGWYLPPLPGLEWEREPSARPSQRWAGPPPAPSASGREAAPKLACQVSTVLGLGSQCFRGDAHMMEENNYSWFLFRNRETHPQCVKTPDLEKIRLHGVSLQKHPFLSLLPFCLGRSVDPSVFLIYLFLFCLATAWLVHAKSLRAPEMRQTRRAALLGEPWGPGYPDPLPPSTPPGVLAGLHGAPRSHGDSLMATRGNSGSSV